jgi:hypothetical protein
LTEQRELAHKVACRKLGGDALFSFDLSVFGR